MNERIKQLRRSLDLTQKAFAERIGSKQNTVATYELGRNIPSDPIIHSICREFHVHEEWLRYGTGEMFVEKDSFSLDEYADANRLTVKEKEIVRGFMELDPEVRKAIYDIFRNAFEIPNPYKIPSSYKISNPYKRAPGTPEELEQMYPPMDMDDRNSKTS
ncbi:MAG: helix-turn-helix domain-containing protein [Lachnospiraceae bacterium]|nr:helix-turn-helix domain-containing protein [Lachnospiraceae bacterium]